jgi:hypothetical protein
LDAAIKTGNVLADQNAQLAAENVALKQIVDSVTDLSNEPQYHSRGMGCGLEDRILTVTMLAAMAGMRLWSVYTVRLFPTLKS